MKLSEELKLRGFIKQSTAEDLSGVLDDEKRNVYYGIDPTADSAHVGNFVNWIFLKHLSNQGHKIVFLVGGGTGMIGDPKPDAERVLVDRATIAERVEKIKSQAEKFFGQNKVEFVDNYDWLSNFKLIDFLRDVGKYFTVNELIKKEAIAKRLESEIGLSYTEFAYPLLQAYDYLQLFRSKNCTLQIGGSDQWGNLVAGVDLVRRLENKVVHAITMPLVVDKTTGKKFGKSEGNAIWIDSGKTTPYAFYQFWLNVSDDGVVDYLKLYTFLTLEEIDRLDEMVKTHPETREAQKVLAKEVTVLVHGETVFEKVKKATECLFGQVSLSELKDEELDILKQNAPLTALVDGTLVVDGLLETGLASSKREAREFLENGSVSVGGSKVGVDYVFDKEKNGNLLYLRRGKKHMVLVEIK
ncbi:MAG: tyrosine--tRNA ligase [Candidatus Paceibacterota bacterium]